MIILGSYTPSGGEFKFPLSRSNNTDRNSSNQWWKATGTTKLPPQRIWSDTGGRTSKPRVNWIFHFLLNFYRPKVKVIDSHELIDRLRWL